MSGFFQCIFYYDKENKTLNFALHVTFNGYGPGDVRDPRLPARSTRNTISINIIHCLKGTFAGKVRSAGENVCCHGTPPGKVCLLHDKGR